jgi:hypothetical protein
MPAPAWHPCYVATITPAAAFAAGRKAYLDMKAYEVPPDAALFADVWRAGFDNAHREWLDEIDAAATRAAKGEP